MIYVGDCTFLGASLVYMCIGLSVLNCILLIAVTFYQRSVRQGVSDVMSICFKMMTILDKVERDHGNLLAKAKSYQDKLKIEIVPSEEGSPIKIRTGWWVFDGFHP